MASLNRAYGLRGAMIALIIGACAGTINGVHTTGDPMIAMKILLWLCASIMLVLAGAIAARRSRAGAVFMAVLLCATFIAMHCGAMAVMNIGQTGDGAITQVWLLVFLFAGPSFLGCLAGRESR